MTADRTQHPLEQLITSACRVVATDVEVGAITIVANRRLTYRELIRVRQHAARCHVAIVMHGDGAVLVRRHAPGGERNDHESRAADGRRAR